jgi:hypothetical protein
MARNSAMRGKWAAVGLVAAGVLLALLSLKFRLTSPIPSAPSPAGQEQRDTEERT